MISHFSEATSESRATLLILLATALIAVVVGGLVVFQPVAAAAAVPALGVIILLRQADRLHVYFLAMLGVVLIGYAFFGRGFAYFGQAPVYISEVVLGLAVLALLVNVRRWRFGPIEVLMLVFMFLGLFATLPHLATYGADALRDAVIWGYAVIALAVAWLVRRHHLETMVRWYGLLLVPLIIWGPLVLALKAILGFDFPDYPWSGMAMVDVKPGDTAVHLAGIAAFILTGLWMKRSALSAITEGLVWAIWFAGFVVAASWNRGGLLAATTAITTMLVLRPDRRMFIPFLSVILVIVPFILVDPSVEVWAEREISVDQVVTNLTSITGGSESTRLDGTREWRLNWWSTIIDYTVRGEYFWSGKGFGINLRTDDLPHATGESNLRSPHSSHMTVLARMGVPGAVAWIALQSAFALMMVTAIYRSYGRGDQRITAILVTIFVYWIAMMINSSFDVYFEGPQGGIWFWAVIGLGIAVTRFQEPGPSSSDESDTPPDEGSTQSQDSPVKGTAR